MATDLILVCHGQSAQRQDGKLLGWWADVPLSPLGQQQALLLGERLQRDFDIGALYTSPLIRADETADILGRMTRVVPVMAPGLRELDGGALASLSYEEAKVRYPDLIVHGRVSSDGRLPGGESYADLHVRVESAISRITSKEAGNQVVIVTHGGPVVAYLRAFMSYMWETRGKPRFICDAASIHHLRIGDGGEKTVVRLNDTAHLAGLPG